MNRFNKVLVSAGAALLSGSLLYTAALAAPDAHGADGPPHGPQAWLSKLDTNHDGIITRAEATAGAEVLFNRLDANHDGKLDRADFELLRQQKREAIRARIFALIDTNHDGVISKAEFLADQPEHGPDGGGNHGPRLGGHGPDGRGFEGHGPDDAGPGHGRFGGPDGEGMKLQMLKRMTGTEGSVSKAVFTAAALKHFDAMDTNHDGRLTAEEQQAGLRMLHERMGGPHGSMQGPMHGPGRGPMDRPGADDQAAPPPAGSAPGQPAG